jgi:hypothetical protein
MTAPRRSRAWIWFFVALALLAAAAVAIPLWFNLSQQLTADELERHEALWQEKRPADYDVEYILKGAAPEHFVVRVRQHRVQSVTSDGRPLAPGSYPFSDMDSLFRYVADFLKQDSQPDRRRTFASAGFSPEDGHITHYVHSVWTTRDRIEVTAVLHRVGEESREQGKP